MELILYATPTGELGHACDEYFARAEALGATVAQTFPPHCTLTGFFHRTAARADAVIDQIGTVLAEAGTVPDGAVTIRRLAITDRWVGLELGSPWLGNLADYVSAAVQIEADEDVVRPKHPLHISLAYGLDDLAAHAALAREVVDPAAFGRWDVAVWERDPEGAWIRHS